MKSTYNKTGKENICLAESFIYKGAVMNFDFTKIPSIKRRYTTADPKISDIWHDSVITFSNLKERFYHGMTIDMPIVIIDRRMSTSVFHKHDYFELVYILKGEIKNCFENKEVFMKAGDLCIMNRETTHALDSYDSEVTLVNICIPLYLFQKGTYCDFYQNDNFVSEFLRGETKENYLYFPLHTSIRYGELMEKILIEVSETKGETFSLVALVLLLLCELSKEKEFSFMGIDKTSYDILKYIDKNYKDVSLKKIAQEFNYSENYVTRMIKARTGIKASKIIRDLRMQHACELLKESGLNVEEIAESVGYKSYTYFYKAFKKTFHITPSEYRHAHQSNFRYLNNKLSNK